MLGKDSPVSIEIKGKPFALIIDVQNTIRQLVDWETGEAVFENTCDAFGKGLSGDIPYAYVGKRYDTFSGLVYFGKRFYDPNLGKWLTPDPLGAVDHSNLYQYVFNNPFKYYDPNGEFVFAIPLLFWGTGLALPTISACITAVTYTAVAGVVAYGGYKAIEAINKNTDVYAPDRPLPVTEDGIPIPEADVPHTELGTKDGSSGIASNYGPQMQKMIDQEMKDRNLTSKEISVQSYNINELLQQHSFYKIDLLSIDVEGSEYEILESWNFKKHPVEVIVVENIFEDPKITSLLSSQGFEHTARIRHDDVYKWSEGAKTP